MSMEQVEHKNFFFKCTLLHYELVVFYRQTKCPNYPTCRPWQMSNLDRLF